MNQRWPLWHHFILTVVLGLTFVFFYSIALAWNSVPPIVDTGGPAPGPPFQIVLDPPDTYNLLPIPMEDK